MAASAGVGAAGVMAGQQVQSITDGTPAPPNVDPKVLQQELAAAQAAASAVSATTVSTTDGGQEIAKLESAYNDAVNKMVADLKTRDAYLTWETGQTKASQSDKNAWGKELASNQKMINDIGTGNAMPRDGFVGTGVSQSPGGSIDGSQNPGVSADAPAPTGYGATGAAASQASKTPPCKGGYIAPPSIPPGADMRQVMGSLTNDQAYFLGWATSQMLKGKQVTVPPQDAQAWSALEQWNLTNNPSLTGGGMPSDMPQNAQNNMALVATACSQTTGVSGEQLFQLIFGAVTAIAMGPLAADGGEAGSLAEGASVTGAETAGRTSLTDEVASGDGIEASEASSGSGAASEVPASELVGDDAYLSDGSAEVSPPSSANGQWEMDYDNQPIFNKSTGLPSPDEANQGPMDDCWFGSVLRAVTRKDPDFIKDGITDLGDDTYKVRLFDQNGNEKDVTVNDTLPYTASGGGAFMGSASGTKWAAIYEKAAAKLMSYEGTKPGVDGYDSLIQGYEQNALQMLTGGKGQENYDIRTGDSGWQSVDTSGAGGPAAPVAGDALWSRLQAATADGAPPDSMVFTGFDDTAPTSDAGLYPNHTYELVGVSGTGDGRTVTLSNPHGSNNLPTGPGVTTNGDQITIPWALFLQRATSILST